MSEVGQAVARIVARGEATLPESRRARKPGRGTHRESLRTAERLCALDPGDVATACCGKPWRRTRWTHAGFPAALLPFKRDNCYYHACVWWDKIGGRVLYRRPEAPLEPETRCTDADEDAFVERVRLLIFSAKLPVGRLALDVEDIRRFTAPDLRSPHLALVRAMPALTPPAAAIVRAMVQAYGKALFGGGSVSAGLRAMIRSGPIAFALAAVLMGPHPRMPAEVLAVMARFREIFRQHPHAHLALARDALASLGLPTGTRPDADP